MRRHEAAGSKRGDVAACAGFWRVLAPEDRDPKRSFVPPRPRDGSGRLGLSGFLPQPRRRQVLEERGPGQDGPAELGRGAGSHNKDSEST